MQVFNFFSEKIQKNDWFEQYAGLIALQSLTLSCSEEKIIAGIECNLEPILNLLNRSEAKIRLVTANIIESICKTAPKMLLKN